ncbi:MAG: DsbA family protein [Ardenticatenaceae bacterium]|nr:DsbA family protein [Anaerolineales bacterium]MCB8919221.1 DsbA family protein [Ardenticatenaceae bacterium]
MAKVVKRQATPKAAQKGTNWYLIGGVIVAGVVALFALLYLSLQQPEPVNLLDYCNSNPQRCVFEGDENAPVTVIEVSDYACSACANFNLTVADQIRETYVNTGQVRWVHLPYSLPQFESRSVPTSMAALCIADQDTTGDLFYPFHLGMFRIQTSDVAFQRAGFDQVAEEIGADLDKLDQCLEEGRFRSDVNANLDAVRLAGVNSTPSFVIDGQVYTNIGSFQQIQQLIEPRLGQ